MRPVHQSRRSGSPAPSRLKLRDVADERDVLEHVIVGPPVPVISGVDVGALQVELRHLRPEADQTVRLLIRQRPQHDSIDDAEDGSRRSDARATMRMLVAAKPGDLRRILVP